ncbi:MAG: Gfo/Idh/MocA family oxidoreductase [Chloroflexi bacterium]|nr:Gfo/Idh/MocA family oxidoreductase [Chloroflexota bacterium]MDA1147110.1 Gfo/Idh/MocA family oxidoreductase [Chloroflexota bacterium]
MTANQPLRIGVIGVGFGARVHVPAFLAEGWEVPVVWGRRQAIAAGKAAELGIAGVAEDWQDLVARDDLDAVAVTTPPAAHREMVMAALRAGKHVLCEKPFALNGVEARAMRDLAREQGLTAMVAHEFRFAPQRAQIKDLLDGGRIGKPELVSAELLMGRPRPDSPPPFSWASDKAQGGGLLGALGSHYIDGLRHWFGNVAEVSGRLTTRMPARMDADGNPREADTDDSFAVTLLFENGVVASMTASSLVAPSLGARITIAGSRGVLVATQRGPNPEPDGVVRAGGAEDRRLEELPVDPRYVPIVDNRDDRLASFRLLVREFERGIREGSSPAPNFDDAVACQEILDAVRAASESGQTIRMLDPRNGHTTMSRPTGSPDRFDRFTGRARAALTQADAEARRRGGPIGTESMLLAIARPNDGPAARALKALGVEIAAVEGAIGRAGRRDDNAGAVRGLTDEAKRAIEFAAAEARELESGEIDSAHLLIGVARSDGGGSRILASFGAQVTAVRSAVVRALVE